MKRKLVKYYKFVYNTLAKAGILSPKARRKTKREFKKQQLLREKKINSTMDEEIITSIVIMKLL